MKKLTFSLGALVLGLGCASPTFAITLSFANGVSATSSSYVAACSNPLSGQNYNDCYTTGFLSDQLATSSTAFLRPSDFGAGSGFFAEDNFLTAFSNFGDGWTQTDATVAEMSALDGINLKVSNFSTGSYTNVGGIGVEPDGHFIKVEVEGRNSLTPALLQQLVWIQGLEINYRPGLPGNNSYSTATTYNVLDDAAFSNATCTALPAGSPANVPVLPGGQRYCGPIYPYQYTDISFFDAPMGPWPDGSFRGIALLATIDTTNKVVTTYAGVNYGFDNTVAPEPGTWVLLLAGCAAVFFARRKAAARG